MEWGLGLLASLCAIASALSGRAEQSLLLLVGAGWFLAALIALDDPVLGGVIVLVCGVALPVCFSHLRRHDTAHEGRRLLLPGLAGGGLAAILLSLPAINAEPTGTPESVAPLATTHVTVLVGALCLLVCTSLVVRIREGRRR